MIKCYNGEMEKFLQKHLGSVIATLAVSGIVSGVTITLQLKMDNELTRQRIAQLDLMMGEMGRRLEKVQDMLQDNTYRQKTAVLETRLDALEKKVDRLQKGF